MDTDVLQSESVARFMGNCSAVKDAYPDRTDSLVAQTFLGIFYTCVCLFGVCGNVLTMYVALCERVSFSVRAVFIASLAYSDLAVGLASLPITAVSTVFTREWVFGSVLCKCIGFIQGCSILSSSFTLMAIAVDRYILIVYPHLRLITYTTAALGVAAFWLTAGLISSPMIVFSKLQKYENICGVFCEEEWPSQWMWAKQSYGLLVLAAQFGAPLLSCSLCYAKISAQLSRQLRQRRQQQFILPENERRLIKRRRRTNRMMVVMVLSFFLTWLPWNFVNLARDFEFASYFIKDDDFNLTFAVCHAVAMTSTAANPIIYSFFNDSFRAAVRNLFGLGGKRGAGYSKSRKSTRATSLTTVQLQSTSVRTSDVRTALLS